MKTAQNFKLWKMGNHGNSLLEKWEEGEAQHLIKEIVSGNDKKRKKFWKVVKLCKVKWSCFVWYIQKNRPWLL